MKASAIACAVLAGTFGISTVASAQDWRGGDRDHDRGQRWEQRHDRHEERGERHDGRQYQQPRYEHRYEYRQPHYVYSQPHYGHAQPRFYRGGYVPREYLRGPYFVSNWNAYPGLYAPPYGYGWVNVDGQYLLVALATGLIANALINGY